MHEVHSIDTCSCSLVTEFSWYSWVHFATAKSFCFCCGVKFGLLWPSGRRAPQSVHTVQTAQCQFPIFLKRNQEICYWKWQLRAIEKKNELIESLTIWNFSQSDAVNVIATITLIAEQHFVFIVLASAFDALLAIFTLPRIFIDTTHHPRRHFQAWWVSCGFSTKQLF